jgi:hypothetical protein
MQYRSVGFNLSSAVSSGIGCRLGGLFPYWPAAYFVLTPSESPACPQSIDWAIDTTPTPIQDAGVDHGGAQVLVAQESRTARTSSVPKADETVNYTG